MDYKKNGSEISTSLCEQQKRNWWRRKHQQKKKGERKQKEKKAEDERNIKPKIVSSKSVSLVGHWFDAEFI